MKKSLVQKLGFAHLRSMVPACQRLLGRRIGNRRRSDSALDVYADSVVRRVRWSPPCCVSVFFRLLSKIHFSMVLFSHFGENGERHGFIRRVRRYGLCPVHDGVQPQLRRFVRRRRWRRGRQRMRLPDRHCSGRGADPDRLGWLNQSLQVKHKFSLWGFFESACRKRWSMIGWG